VATGQRNTARAAAATDSFTVASGGMDTGFLAASKEILASAS